MPNTKHDKIAKQVAKRKGGEYNPSKGADIVTPQVVIEVEVDQGKLGEGIRQLQGYRKPRLSELQHYCGFRHRYR